MPFCEIPKEEFVIHPSVDVVDDVENDVITITPVDDIQDENDALSGDEIPHLETNSEPPSDENSFQGGVEDDYSDSYSYDGNSEDEIFVSSGPDFNRLFDRFTDFGATAIEERLMGLGYARIPRKCEMLACCCYLMSLIVSFSPNGPEAMLTLLLLGIEANPLIRKRKFRGHVSKVITPLYNIFERWPSIHDFFTLIQLFDIRDEASQFGFMDMHDEMFFMLFDYHCMHMNPDDEFDLETAAFEWHHGLYEKMYERERWDLRTFSHYLKEGETMTQFVSPYKLERLERLNLAVFVLLNAENFSYEICSLARMIIFASQFAMPGHSLRGRGGRTSLRGMSDTEWVEIAAERMLTIEMRSRYGFRPMLLFVRILEDEYNTKVMDYHSSPRQIEQNLGKLARIAYLLTVESMPPRRLILWACQRLLRYLHIPMNPRGKKFVTRRVRFCRRMTYSIDSGNCSAYLDLVTIWDSPQFAHYPGINAPDPEVFGHVSEWPAIEQADLILSARHLPLSPWYHHGLLRRHRDHCPSLAYLQASHRALSSRERAVASYYDSCEAEGSDQLSGSVVD